MSHRRHRSARSLCRGCLRAPRWTALLVALLCCACRVELDAGQPIAIVPAEGWRPDQIAVLEQAAAAWNLELGTQLRVTRAPGDSQRAVFRLSPLVCGYYGALTRHLDEVTVDVCQLVAEIPDRLFETARHELGHVLNIEDHAADPRAVMATGVYGRYFRPEDHQLFAQANPDLAGQGGCSVIRQVGGTTLRVALAQGKDRAPTLIWAEAESVRLAPLSVETGAAGPPLAIPLEGRPRWLGASSTAGQLMLVWANREETGVMARRVTDGPGAPPVELAPLALPGEARWLDAAVTSLQDALLLVTPVELDGGGRVVCFARRDPSTGGALPWHLQAIDGAWATAAAWADGALVLHPQDSETLLLWVDDRGAPLAQLPLPLHADEGHVLVHGEHADQALVALREGGTIILARVALTPTLRLMERVSLPLPGGSSSLPGLSLLEASHQVHLVAAAGGPLGASEVFLMRFFAAETLPGMPAWQPISAQDLTHSVRPLLASGADGRLIVVWRDLHLGDTQIRSRCVEP